MEFQLLLKLFDAAVKWHLVFWSVILERVINSFFCVLERLFQLSSSGLLLMMVLQLQFGNRIWTWSNISLKGWMSCSRCGGKSSSILGKGLSR